MSLKKLIIIVVCVIFLIIGWTVIITQFKKQTYIVEFVDKYFEYQEDLVVHLLKNCSLSQAELNQAYEHLLELENQCRIGTLKKQEFFEKMNEYTTTFNSFVEDWHLTYEQREAKPDCMTEEEARALYQPLKKHQRNVCLQFYGDIPARTALYFVFAKRRIEPAFDYIKQGYPPQLLFPE